MDELVKLRISGHSVILTVPKELLDQLGWRIGDYIKLTIEDQSLKAQKIEV